MEIYNNVYERTILSCIINKPFLIEDLECEETFLTIKYKNFLNEFRELYKKEKNPNMEMIMLNCKSLNMEEIYEISNLFYTENGFSNYQNAQIEEYKKIELKKIMCKYVKDEIGLEEYKERYKNIENIVSGNIQDNLSAKEIFEMVTTKQDRLQFTNSWKYLSDEYNFLEHSCYVLSARPAVGKSSFALNLINSLRKNYTCIYFNMEMNESELYKRMIGIMTNLPISLFDNEQWRKMENNENAIAKASNELASDNNLVIKNGSKSVNQIRSIIKRYSKEKGHIVAFVDHIGYVRTDSQNQGDYQRITDAMRELQLMTKDYNCTIFVISHMRRDSEMNMDALKGSGELEQSAHSIIQLENLDEKDLDNSKPTIRMHVTKNRGGQLGTKDFTFIKKSQLFELKHD